MCAGCAGAARPAKPLPSCAVRVLQWICSGSVWDLFESPEGVPQGSSLRTEHRLSPAYSRRGSSCGDRGRRGGGAAVPASGGVDGRGGGSRWGGQHFGVPARFEGVSGAETGRRGRLPRGRAGPADRAGRGGEVLDVLLRLELAGRVEQLPGNRYCRRFERL